MKYQKSKCKKHPDSQYYLKGSGAYCIDCNTLVKSFNKASNNKQDFNIDYVLKSGKHEGKTILQAVQDDKKWAKWCSENLENDYIKESIKQAMRQS